MKKPIGIIRFLGTNCDYDVKKAVEECHLKAKFIDFRDSFNPSDFEAFVLPGGFSYGDYLRSGALASCMPVMTSIKEAVKQDRPVLGICNGFQILCESDLLPGCLIQNDKLKFIDKIVPLRLEKECSCWAGGLKTHINLPIAHQTGCYFIESDGLKRLQDEQMIWWSYENNPNGSVKNIAGIKKGKLAALMPHPERAMHSWMGSEDGRLFFETLLS